MEFLVFNILTLLEVKSEHHGSKWVEDASSTIKTTDYIWQYPAYLQFGLKLGKICKIDKEKVFEGITHLFSKLYILKRLLEGTFLERLEVQLESHSQIFILELDLLPFLVTGYKKTF